jgi:hypothetical protein
MQAQRITQTEVQEDERLKEILTRLGVKIVFIDMNGPRGWFDDGVQPVAFANGADLEVCALVITPLTIAMSKLLALIPREFVSADYIFRMVRRKFPLAVSLNREVYTPENGIYRRIPLSSAVYHSYRGHLPVDLFMNKVESKVLDLLETDPKRFVQPGHLWAHEKHIADFKCGVIRKPAINECMIGRDYFSRFYHPKQPSVAKVRQD